MCSQRWKSAALPVTKLTGLYTVTKSTKLYLLGVESGVANHDVAVNSDGQDCEERHSHKAVAGQREELAQQFAMTPGALPERGGSQRQVETAEHEVGDTQVDDKHCGGVPDLRTGGALVRHCHQKASSTTTYPFIHLLNGCFLRRTQNVRE